MKIHELQLQSSPDRKRVGRGIGSGYGKTAGRGTKGQNARTGGGVRLGFEGGQNPLAKRLPKKRGFSPLSQTIYQVVNLSSLASFKANSTIDLETLRSAGLVKKASQPVKLLGQGDLKHKLTIQVHAASASAKVAVEAAGGTVQIIAFVRSPKAATRPTSDAAPASDTTTEQPVAA